MSNRPMNTGSDTDAIDAKFNQDRDFGINTPRIVPKTIARMIHIGKNLSRQGNVGVLELSISSSSTEDEGKFSRAILDSVELLLF